MNRDKKGRFYKGFTPWNKGTNGIMKAWNKGITGFNIKDISGQKFGRLTAIRYIKSGNHTTYWMFRCDCGVEKILVCKNVCFDSSETKSCGCFRKELDKIWKPRISHGMRGTRFYGIYGKMVARCKFPNNPKYKDYAGRGIKCFWHSFEEFRDDMYESYKIHVEIFGEKDTSIDRRDNNGHYCKKNCHWITRKEQNRNTRTNHFVEFMGERKPISAWAEQFGMKYELLRRRIGDGWSAERAINQESSQKVK